LVLKLPRAKNRRSSGDARAEDSAKTAASYPIILRSYEPVADLDERLRRIFAVLSLPLVVE
jgi:hypothetical protein